MIKCDNISKKQVVSEELFVIWVDIRGSSEINEIMKNDAVGLHEIYKNVLEKTDNTLNKCGFHNIDIQGDGIYGVTNNGAQSVKNAIREINELAINDFNYDGKKKLVTVSINYGKEVFSCFGGVENKNQMAFFGNVVSKAKKWISNSIWSNKKKTRMILSKEAFTKLEMSEEERRSLSISLKGSKKNKKYRGYY